MRMALEDARVSPDAVDYVNAHGTSTPVGDVEESRAIAAVFGAHATDKKLWVSSTKSMMGHLLGAAGAVESGDLRARHRARATSRRPSTSIDQDPECTLDYVANTARERRLRHAMNNSFGFGGTNCALAAFPLRRVGARVVLEVAREVPVLLPAREQGHRLAGVDRGRRHPAPA